MRSFDLSSEKKYKFHRCVAMAYWLVSIDEVTLGPVSTGMGEFLAGIPPQYLNQLLGQFILLPSAGQEMSTIQRAMMLYGWEMKAVHEPVGGR